MVLFAIGLVAMPLWALERVRLEMELLDKLRRTYTLARRVVKTFVPEEVAASTA